MYQAYTHYGNCVDCSQYTRLSQEEQCPICSTREHELLTTAKAYIQSKSNVTRDELVENLKIEPRRIEKWIRKGKVQCVVIQNRCPYCGRSIVNQFTCTHCGYSHKDILAQHLEEEERIRLKPVARLSHRRLQSRFDRSRR